MSNDNNSKKQNFNAQKYNGNKKPYHEKNNTMRESIYDAYGFRNPRDVGLDGQHFINIHQFGKTNLGRKLHFDTELHFSHPETTGTFKCMAGFQKWVRSPSLDERIKTMKGKNLYNFGDHTRHDVPNYKALVIEAWWYQITSYSEVVKAIINTEIEDELIKLFLKDSGYKGDINYYPFDMIYADMANRVLFRPTGLQQFNVIIEGINNIRECLIRNESKLILPDDFYTDRTISSYESIYGKDYDSHFDNFVQSSGWGTKPDENKNSPLKPYDGEIPEDLLVDLDEELKEELKEGLKNNFDEFETNQNL